MSDNKPSNNHDKLDNPNSVSPSNEDDFENLTLQEKLDIVSTANFVLEQSERKRNAKYNRFQQKIVGKAKVEQDGDQMIIKFQRHVSRNENGSEKDTQPETSGETSVDLNDEAYEYSDSGSSIDPRGDDMNAEGCLIEVTTEEESSASVDLDVDEETFQKKRSLKAKMKKPVKVEKSKEEKNKATVKPVVDENKNPKKRPAVNGDERVVKKRRVPLEHLDSATAIEMSFKDNRPEIKKKLDAFIEKEIKNWHEKEKPKLAEKDYYNWRRYQKIALQDLNHLNESLQKQIDALLDQNSQSDLDRRFQNLIPTIHNIEKTKYLQNLINGPMPEKPKKSETTPKPKRTQPKQIVIEDDESESDDFIDDSEVIENYPKTTTINEIELSDVSEEMEISNQPIKKSKDITTIEEPEDDDLELEVDDSPELDLNDRPIEPSSSSIQSIGFTPENNQKPVRSFYDYLRLIARQEIDLDDYFDCEEMAYSYKQVILQEEMPAKKQQSKKPKKQKKMRKKKKDVKQQKNRTSQLLDETDIAMLEQEYSLKQKKKMSQVHQEIPKTIPEADTMYPETDRTIGDKLKVVIPNKIYARLYKHQLEGIKFMWRNIEQDSGCILAQCMGLGKTLQTIVCIYLFFQARKEITKVLVIAPKSTTHVWRNQFIWWGLDKAVYDLHRWRSKNEKLSITTDWDNSGGVLLISPQSFAKIYIESKRSGHYMTMYNLIIKNSPHMLVLDEATLKNATTQLHEVLLHSDLKTKIKLFLTGYPLQNIPKELWYLVNVIYDDSDQNPLGTEEVFDQFFQEAIDKGMHKNATQQERDIVPYRVDLMRSLLNKIMYWVGESVLTQHLPKPKRDFVIYIPLTEAQKEMCNFTFNLITKEYKNKQVFFNYHLHWKLCAHFDLLEVKKQRIRNRKRRRKRKIDDDPDYTESEFDFFSDAASDTEMEDFEKVTTLSGEDQMYLNILYELQEQLKNKNYQSNMKSSSSKMMVLFSIIENAVKMKEKILIFSKYIMVFDVLEQLLENEYFDEKKKIKWRKDFNYLRFDGQSSRRQQLIDRYQNDPGIKLMLISKQAGGFGITLTAATRIVLFDADWNPCIDTQSAFRAYRFGQNKPIFIYRLVSDGTYEDLVFNRQVSKAKFKQLVDEQKGTLDEKKEFSYSTFRIRDTPFSKPDEQLLNEDPVLKDVYAQNKAFISRIFEYKSLFSDESIQLDPQKQKKTKEEFNEFRLQHIL